MGAGARVMSDHNSYYQPIEESYAARLDRLPRFALWRIIADPDANVNKRVAALRLYVDKFTAVAGLSANDYVDTGESLWALSKQADRQGARALADIAFELGDELKDTANTLRYERGW